MHSDSALAAAARGRARDIARLGPEAGRLAYIDGMRAIAILAIIAFHARIPGFQGGFVGVDIFFVISGFLITTQIVEQTLAGRFTPTDFYARRILRILPPLLLVTCVTLAIAPLFPLIPRELRELANSAAATAAMASNYYFSSGTEYFAVRSEIVPLLHTWSLGVEEQYYLLAPPVIGAAIAAAARRKWRPVAALLLAGVAAVAGSYLVLAILTKTDHRLAFFSILSRAWQFSLGGMLAIAIIGGNTVPARFRRVLGIVGFVAIVASVVLFDPHITYPGLIAGCLPTFGALLLLTSGLGNERAPLIQILASRPVVTIGVLSYSWYLWHWPLTALARTLPVAHGSHWKDIAATSVALVLSVPTYLFLEQPMKSLRRSDITRRFGGRIVLAGIAGSVVVAVVAMALARSPLFVGNVRGVNVASAASQPLSGCRSTNAIADFKYVKPCLVGVADAPSVVVWGDSHALMLAPVAEWAARSAHGAAVILGKTSCPPLLGVEVDFFVARTCATSNDELLRWFQKQKDQTMTGVVLAARWLLYSGHNTPAGDAELPRLLWHDSDRPSSGYADIIDRGLTDMLKAISPAHRVLIVGPVPELEHPPADCLMRAQISGEPRKSCLLDRSKVERRNIEAMTVLKRVAAAFPNVRVIDPMETFCDGQKCTSFGPQGVYYLDTDHLTSLGAEVLYRHFERDFLWIFGKASEK